MLKNYTAPEEFLQRLTEITESNLSSEHFGVSELAKQMGISRSSLHRRVKQLTNKSASRFICGIKLRNAYQLLAENAGSVSEIAFRVGFSSSTYFSKCFHDFYGISPGEVKNGKKPLNADNKKNSDRTNRKKPVVIFVVFILILFFSGGAIYKTYQKQNHTKCIMILTPESEYKNTELASVMKGLQHAIKNKLNRLNGLNVVSEDTPGRQSKSGFKMNKSARNEVDYILLFQPVSIKGSITIYAELTDTHSNKVLISEPYELAEISDKMFTGIEEFSVSLVSNIKGKIPLSKNKDRLLSSK